MNGAEHPLLHEAFESRSYELTLDDINRYGHRAIFEHTRAADWIASHRLPRQGHLDIEMTAAGLGIPVKYDAQECGGALTLGTTKGLPGGPEPPNTPLEIYIHPDREEANDYRVTFGHEVGHVFLELALNYKHNEYSREVEDFCDLFGLHFAIPQGEINRFNNQVTEKDLLNLHDTYGVKMSELIYEFVYKGFLPERMYIDSVIGWGKRAGEIHRDVICAPCRNEFGSCEGHVSQPDKILSFPDREFGGCFPLCKNDGGSFDRNTQWHAHFLGKAVTENYEEAF